MDSNSEFQENSLQGTGSIWVQGH